MNYTSFCDALYASVSAHLAPDSSISRETIRKNNGVMLDAWMIRTPDCIPVPVIYLQPLFQSYQNGSSLEAITHMVLAGMNTESILFPELGKHLRDLDISRNHITFRLVSREKNMDLLEDIPWIPFLDLAVIFSLHITSDNDRQLSSIIHNHLADVWQLSQKELFSLAKQNTPRLHPPVFKDLEQLLLDMQSQIPKPEYPHPFPPLYLLTNPSGIHGAACLLYEDIIKDFADSIGSDLIVLPSSIHEVLLMPDSHTWEYPMLQEMIQTINAAEVPREDILSDHLYLYRRNHPSGFMIWTPSNDTHDTDETLIP